MKKNVAIIGSSGALGSAFTKQLADIPETRLYAFTRQLPAEQIAGVSYQQIDYQDEDSIAHAAHMASEHSAIDWVIVTIGMLHEGKVMPEKSLHDISAEKLKRLFEVNTIYPTLIAKHFLPALNRNSQSLFAALSARVGSITDNKLGGWYAYRSSKAALNMMIKNAAIEIRRRNKHAIIVGLHPGTVDSNLSKPFQANVPAEKLFSADYSVAKLISVLQQLTPEQSGSCIDWDGKVIAP